MVKDVSSGASLSGIKSQFAFWCCSIIQEYQSNKTRLPIWETDFCLFFKKWYHSNDGFFNLDTVLYPHTQHLICFWHPEAGNGGRGSGLQKSIQVDQTQCSRDRPSVLVTIWKICRYGGTWLFWWNIDTEGSDVRWLSGHHIFLFFSFFLIQFFFKFNFILFLNFT